MPFVYYRFCITFVTILYINRNMKKLLAMLAALTALVGLSSCTGLVDSWNQIPGFSVMSTMYDGQTFRLVRMSKCKYAWTVENPDIVTLRTEGEEAWIQVNLPEGATEPVKVKITARNAELEDGEPFHQEFWVCPWRLSILKKVDQPGQTYIYDNDVKGVGGYEYSCVMEAYQPDDTNATKPEFVWKSVSSIPLAIRGLKEETDKLTWTIDENDKEELTDLVENPTHLTFVIDHVINRIPIKATLGKVSHETVIFDSTF